MRKRVNCATIKEIEKLKEIVVGVQWNRWVANKIHLDQSSPLQRNGPHCVECLHEMGKLLLYLVPGEPFSLVQDLATKRYRGTRVENNSQL